MYLQELELKSLIIRIKNARITNGTVKSNLTICDNSYENRKENSRITKYINWYTSLESKKDKRTKLIKEEIFKRVITLSEKTVIDKKCYERFGEAIIILIKRILSQGKYSGYSYYDEFISDSIDKILKYLDNFDHTKISEITKQPVSAFSYLTQIINNSVIFVINKMKKEQDFIQNEINCTRTDMGMNITDYDFFKKNKETKTYTNINTVLEVLEIIENEKKFLKENNLVIEHNMEELEDFEELYKIQKKYKNLILRTTYDC